jgi:hypothetical protein
VKFEKLLEQVPALRKAMAKDDDVKVPVVPPVSLTVEPVTKTKRE